MELEQKDIEYFNWRQRQIPKFWRRLGGKPNLSGADVLDVGCGYGSLCVDTALSGARRVLGIDTNLEVIEFAREYVRRHIPETQNMMRFVHTDLRDFEPDVRFDIIVSEDAFEHILDIEAVVEEMSERLKPGGRLYTGFGPLWNSPFGGHRRMKMPIPWGHLLLPESLLLWRLNRSREDKLFSMYDLGLSKMSMAGFKRLFERSGLAIAYFRANHGDNFISRMFARLAKLPQFEEWFSHDIYAVLEKTRMD